MPITHEPAVAAGLCAKIEQRHAVAQALQAWPRLDDLGARSSASRARAPCRSAGTPSKSWDRQHDARVRRPGDQIVEPRAPFDVDVLGAERERVGEDPLALLFGSAEAAALPRRRGR